MNIEIKGQSLRNAFLFDSMLTPKIITFVYWLALIGCIAAGIAAMGQRSMGILPGIGIIIGGPIIARIWCELLIVMFKINENLQKLRSEMQEQRDE